MGKVASLSSDSDEPSERNRKKKRKKELEELRRNALAAKRNSRNRLIESKKSKTTLMKTLNQFASKRKEIEDITECHNLLLNKVRSSSTNNKEKRTQKPLLIKGFFRAGVKGKLLKRSPSTEKKKLKNAFLQGDALQLMQSSNICSSKVPENNSQPIKAIDPYMKMEFNKILNAYSESNSDGEDSEPAEKVIKLSPILGGAKCFKKKIPKIILSQVNESPAIKFFTKEEKCKRRLFENENENVECLNINQSNRSIPSRKSTPENVLFFTEYNSSKNVNRKLSKDSNNEKINPLDSQIINCYVQTCKLIAETDIQNMFWNVEWKKFSDEDPLETAKNALKNIYRNTFKDYISQQKISNFEQKYRSVDQTTNSSNSEILLEPDSAIARTLKKNIQLQRKTSTRISDTNSDTCLSNLEKDFPIAVKKNNENDQTKRKRVPSSRDDNSEIEVPCSTKANADPESARIELKMDFIHPERQELIARYLKDVTTNNAYEEERNIFNEQRDTSQLCNDYQLENEKLYIGNNMKGTLLLHKATKHVPAILRKNRSSHDSIVKEKVLLSIEKNSGSNEVSSKTSIQDFIATNNLKSERTPNCGNLNSNQLMEAPKCKYVHMNAKYNPPSRINIPLIQNKKYQQNTIPEKHLFPSPTIIEPEKEFIVRQNFEISPIAQQFNICGNKHDFLGYQLSQENSEPENNCMVRTASFNELQDRTNHLTLCSSQSQKCSQESIEQMNSSQEQYCELRPTFCYKHCEPSDNYVAHSKQIHTNFKDKTLSQAVKLGVKAIPSYHLHKSIKYNEKPYIPNNEGQLLQSENYSFKRPEDISCQILNSCETCRKQSLQYNQESLITCVPIQQQNIIQPVKFIAVEGNRVPQRHPIYNASDSNSYSYIHKATATNQQCPGSMKQFLHDYCPRDASNQPRYEMSSVRFNPKAVPSNELRSSNYYSEIAGLGTNVINLIPNNISDASFFAQHNKSIPAYSSISNERYNEQQIQIPMTSTLYAQVGYQHNHCNNNKGYKLNDVYLK